jgi:hypothetical protein
MKRGVKSIIVITLLILLFLLAVSMISYVFYSRSSPYVWEIIIASIMVSLLLGVISKFIDKLFEKPIAAKPITCLIVVSTCLLVLIVLLIYLSNVPKEIHREIPVTYLVSPRTKELPYGLRFADTSTSVSYKDAMFIFKNFKDKSPDNAKKIENITSMSGHVDILCAMETFQNLTEYLVAYYMGHPFATPETDLTMYREETAKSLGLPHKDIAGNPKSIESISGDFKSNLFYGIKGMLPNVILELRLPKNTEISFKRDVRLPSSQFILKNKYMEIKIGVFFYVGGSQSVGFFDNSVLSFSSNAEELKKVFLQYETVIYYDVTFNKWRYAYPEMKYYEEWANDLFSMLERKFRWGSSVASDAVERRKLEDLYETYMKKEKNSNQ